VKSPASSDVRSLVTLILGAVALVALLTWWGGWALPVVIGSIFVMVMGHEFGHYVTAKRSGMLVTDFFVGFGPVSDLFCVPDARRRKDRGPSHAVMQDPYFSPTGFGDRALPALLAAPAPRVVSTTSTSRAPSGGLAPRAPRCSRRFSRRIGTYPPP